MITTGRKTILTSENVCAHIILMLSVHHRLHYRSGLTVHLCCILVKGMTNEEL